MTPSILHEINMLAWVAANVAVIYVCVVLTIFVVGYYALFDPKATTAGRFIFRFAFSLLGVVGLVFISVYVDPIQSGFWFNLPPDIDWWRPVVRLLAYSYVAYTITALTVLLVLRKWFPEKLKTAASPETLVKVRNPNS